MKKVKGDFLRTKVNLPPGTATPPAKMSKRRLVTSGIPQESVLGLVLFNIFIGNMNSGIEWTFSRPATNTELCGAVDMLEGRDAIQRDHDRREK